MNLYSLPFRDMISFGGYCIAGVDPNSNILCLNMMEFPDEEMKQLIEERIEGTLSHESNHAVLNEVINLGRSLGLDFFDGFDTEYEISLASHSSEVNPE